MNKLEFKNLFKYSVYVISDSIEVLIKAVNDGARIIQLRDKESELAVVRHKAEAIKNTIKDQEYIFIINDYPELAVEVGADGLHVGQDALSISEVRSIVGQKMLIGKSSHSPEQGMQACNEDVDYVAVGPVFRTPTKPGKPAVGLEYVRYAAEHFTKPFVTIGGINLTNVNKVIAAGAYTIAVVRAAGETREILGRLKKSGN